MKRLYTLCIIISLTIVGILCPVRVSAEEQPNQEEISEELYGLRNEVRSISDEFNRIKLISLILLVVLGLSVLGIVKYAQNKVKEIIDKAVYRVDPTFLEIKIPSQNFTDEQQRLEQLGFRNLRKYVALDKSCANGCVIYKANDAEQLNVLKTYLGAEKPNEFSVGYVVYSRKQLNSEPLDEFNNITYANSPLTLVNAIYTVARSLIKEE